MATSMTDTRPSFSRITEGGSTRSWKAAVPAVIVIVAFVALLAYLASQVSSYSQKALALERENQTLRDQQAGFTKQIASLQAQVALATSPGRTTVILESSDKKAKDDAWAAVTWGELPDGQRSWMRVNAYGLEKLAGGKTYHVWFQPLGGEPVQVGALEPDQSGSGFAMALTLPPIDQGEAAMLSIDEPNSKQPGQLIAKADLPKLQPMMKAPPASPAEQPQARPGETTQPMHQEDK
jgi:hypothetical protein